MKTLKIIIIGISLFNIISCQKEENEIITETNNQQNLTVTSPLINLIERVSQNPTAKDNILDKCNCFSVVLPVSLTVDGQNVNVATEADYIIVKNIINSSNTDDDIIHFQFPINIKFKNSQVQVITSDSQLNSVIQNCYSNDDGLGEIECVHFVFPITINTYNAGSQTPTVIVIQNNVQLYNFLENLNSSVLIAFVYPITIINPNGQNVIVHNNDELEDLIEDSISSCSQNSGGGGGGNPTFTSVITSGNWHISYFFDDLDLSANYIGYNFTFNSNGTVLVIKNSNSINGNWSTYMDSGDQKVVLSNFDGNSLDNIEEDWKLIEFTSTLIKLKHISGGNGGTDYLYFTKN